MIASKKNKIFSMVNNIKKELSQKIEILMNEN